MDLDNTGLVLVQSSIPLVAAPDIDRDREPEGQRCIEGSGASTCSKDARCEFESLRQGRTAAGEQVATSTMVGDEELVKIEHEEHELAAIPLTPGTGLTQSR